MRELLKREEKKKEKYFQLVENRKYKEAEETLHRLQRGTYIGDLVYGANDGIVTTFAVVAGATGALLSPGIIIILGIANLIADGFSMGASSFLALRSERAFVRMQRKKEEWEVEQFPEIEREEIRVILKRWGVSENEIEPATRSITKDKKRWVDLMMREELDLKEGEAGSAKNHGFVTFGAFVVAGSLPLVPYLFPGAASQQFLFSAVLAALAFFGVGAARTLITDENALKGGAEILLVGGVAAVAAFGIGWFVKTVFDIVI